MSAQLKPRVRSNQHQKRNSSDQGMVVTENDAVFRVVICDDHPGFAKGVARLLEDEAKDLKVVGIASNGEEAIAIAKYLLPDVVLTDIRMPVMGGIEVTRAIKAALPNTKVIVLTVSDEQADLYQALRAGASGYITKDRDVSEIAGVVRSVLKGHLMIPADLASNFLQDLEATDSAELSDIEREILGAIAMGETNKEIAARLHLSERTVCRRIEDVYSKLHLANRLAAAIWAAQRGLGMVNDGV
jgi:DNA-binding NarL/FixJ family response regulator